jgi:potassium-transporting ATPase ATP-binding subunit
MTLDSIAVEGTPSSSPSPAPGAVDYWRVFVDTLKKLDPRELIHNPVMFVVEIGMVVVAFFTIGAIGNSSFGYDLLVTIILLFTILFATFAEAFAEARGRAQADFLRRTKSTTEARRIAADGRIEPGELIPGDGDVVEGIGSVDESAITGESAPVIKAGGDSVTGGTRLLSDHLVVEITANPGDTFLDRMIALVEGAVRQKTPNEIALTALLAVLTLIFVLVVVTLVPIAGYYSKNAVSITTAVALLVCLIPTTIGALLSAIGIAGINRVAQVNVVAKSGRAVEAAGDIDTLILDKTGTITYGNRMATDFIAMPGVETEELVRVSLMASLADTTPEGRSIVELALKTLHLAEAPTAAGTPVEFTAQTRLSGIDLADGRVLRKGAISAVAALAEKAPPELQAKAEEIASQGGTPLGVVVDGRVLGVIQLQDVIKQGLKERFAEFRAMGIRTVMVTGDNRTTAAYIAGQAGVDDFVAEAKPEDKIALTREEQGKGKLVAVTGDGTNDAPALAQADVGLAMNSGTMAAKEAGNMIDLESNPTKLLDVVMVGKQLLITRGALTTFSIANDVAKYFAIIPAMFAVIPTLKVLSALNIMGLKTPHGAILSALIFNALIIPALIPFAIRGVRNRAESADKMLLRNIFNWGVLGVIIPFVGIFAIDRALGLFGLS